MIDRGENGSIWGRGEENEVCFWQNESEAMEARSGSSLMGGRPLKRKRTRCLQSPSLNSEREIYLCISLYHQDLSIHYPEPLPAVKYSNHTDAATLPRPASAPFQQDLAKPQRSANQPVTSMPRTGFMWCSVFLDPVQVSMSRAE